MDTKKILLIVQIILSVFLILTILLQVRGSGLGSIFGNVGGEFYRSKRGLEKLLSRATTIIAILFVSNCIALAYLYAI